MKKKSKNGTAIKNIFFCGLINYYQNLFFSSGPLEPTLIVLVQLLYKPQCQYAVS